MYYQLGGRFSDHLSSESLSHYNASVAAFKRAIEVDPRRDYWCERSPIPYTDDLGSHTLHAYMCRPGARGSVTSRPTVLAMGGYDSSAELTFHEVGVLSLTYGYNVYV